jgi:hypothetical protein
MVICAVVALAESYFAVGDDYIRGVSGGERKRVR